MTTQIDKALLQELLTANQSLSNAITQILTSLDDERWVTSAQAEAELGIPAQTVRYLARTGKVASRKLSDRRVEVLFSDLQERA
jgi:hypothetical protein